MEEVAAMKPRSQVQKRAAQLATRIALEHNPPAGEIEAILTMGARRVAQLTASPESQIPEDIPESTANIEQPWSPSGILDSMPSSRDADWRERQLPRGDRD